MKPGFLPDTPTRLDRFLSHATGLSRAEVKRLLRTNVVTVDALPASDPAMQVHPQQSIALQGKPLDWPGRRYLMLHKPAAHVCGFDDPHYPPVNALVDTPWSVGLHSAGRLDADTTGLVLLTNDGQWSHRITSPRRNCPKTYLVGLAAPVDAELLRRFAEGLLLQGETRPTLPASIELLGRQQARVTIHEGRYHQVKRMFAACGNHVLSLHRERIGAIQLDADLAAGQWRPLNPTEIDSVLTEPHENDDDV